VSFEQSAQSRFPQMGGEDMESQNFDIQTTD
jgi:hypothetical protein